jgi:hypothetical protein
MRSSDLALRLLLALALWAPAAHAQRAAQGYGVDRLYVAPPGAGWFVMDDLDIRGRLGGAMGLSLGWARNPLVLQGSGGRFALVSDEVTADIGAAVSYRRFRFSLGFSLPFVVIGESGRVGDVAYTAPAVDPGSLPDGVGDVRLGVDVRALGEPGGPFRLGASAQLFLPSGRRADYISDATLRGMLRVLFAGDLGRFVYAGHLGVHVRPLDDEDTPGSPRGSELLFGLAAGVKLPVRGMKEWAVALGPELFGATAFRAMFQGPSTPFEGLLTARLEGTGVRGLQLRARLGGGIGFNRQLGAPDWRVVAGVEVFNHNAP